jgi:hypothetical protein
LRRPCLTCGALLTSGSYRAGCEPVRESRSTPGRGSGTAIARFHAAVLARAGHRCQWVDADGVRCTVTDTRRLEAHHVVAIVDGGDAEDTANGVALCGHHHRLAERLSA